MEFKFEDIDTQHKRAKVFGGWLVKAYEQVTHISEVLGVVDNYDWRITMTFVPDPKHERVIAPTTKQKS